MSSELDIVKSKETIDLDWPEGVTPQEKLFVSFYVSDAHWNASKAYIMAGLAEDNNSSVKVKANQMASNKRVQEAINQYVDNIVEVNKTRAKVNIIEMQQARAFYDPSEILNADGSLKYANLEDMPPEVRKVVDGIETRWYGKDADTKATIVKLADRNKALDSLSKHLRLNEEEEEEKTNAPPVVNLTINGSPQISDLPEELQEAVEKKK